MDLLHKAFVTAGVVAALLWLLRQAGPRLGGLAAALPTTSLPALVWLGLERGGDAVAAAASGALLTTALTPLLAAVYGRLSPRRAPLPCLLASLAVLAAALVVLAPWLGRTAYGGLALALGLCALALRLLPSPPARAPQGADWRRELLLTAAVAGALTLMIGLLAGPASATQCGLLAALPVVGLSTLCSTHRQHGAAAVCHFLRGYVEGIAAKAVFLALLIGAMGGLPLAWAWLGAAAGGVFTLVMLRHPKARQLWVRPTLS